MTFLSPCVHVDMYILKPSPPLSGGLEEGGLRGCSFPPVPPAPRHSPAVTTMAAAACARASPSGDRRSKQTGDRCAPRC